MGRANRPSKLQCKQTVLPVMQLVIHHVSNMRLQIAGCYLLYTILFRLTCHTNSSHGMDPFIVFIYYIFLDACSDITPADYLRHHCRIPIGEDDIYGIIYHRRCNRLTQKLHAQVRASIHLFTVVRLLDLLTFNALMIFLTCKVQTKAVSFSFF
jgi:hypothetical protein